MLYRVVNGNLLVVILIQIRGYGVSNLVKRVIGLWVNGLIIVWCRILNFLLTMLLIQKCRVCHDVKMLLIIKALKLVKKSILNTLSHSLSLVIYLSLGSNRINNVAHRLLVDYFWLATTTSVGGVMMWSRYLHWFRLHFLF
jgi:hypothetical protein